MEQNTSRREKKKQEVKDKIVKNALVVFTEKGFTETTVADIMNRADLGTGTFYNYFESKEDMINHCIHEKILEAKNSVENFNNTNLSATEKLSRILHATGKIFEENKPLLGLFFGILRVNPDIKRIPSHGNIFKDILMEIIRQGQTEGEFNSDIPPQIVTEMVHGILQSTLSSSLSDMSFSDNLKYKLNLLFTGLCKQRGGI